MTPEDERVEDLLDEWEEAFEGGRDLSVTELCRNDPDLAPLLEAKINQLKRLNGMLEQTSGSEAPGQQVSPAKDICIESRFLLNDFIDEGGLGTIYAGYDQILRREAAVKFLRMPHANEADCVKQFKTECEITSRLDHPSVVPIYGHGTLDNGQPYYVMRRISGQTMAERAKQLHKTFSQDRPTSAQRLELHSLLADFIAVCRAIHYAHCRGVVHRDIKPANVMIGRHGETTVLDWGLAQTIDRDDLHQVPAEETLQVTSNAMVANQSIGTPMYMSPEQHDGSGAVGVRSDVYSLGATLFVLLGGEAPFQGETLAALKSQVLRGEATNLKAKYRWLPTALIAICKTAMSVDPKKRYATALQVAREVERYLADEPVHACPDTFLRKAGRWLSRHRFKSFVIASCLLAGVIGSLAYSTVVTNYARREHAALEVANHARVRSLTLASGFAANIVALKMSERWRILEIAAQDDTLIELLEAPEDGEGVKWNAFQGKLSQFKDSYHVAAGEPESWFLCDASGRQMARVKQSDSIGKNYAHRDYFHGKANVTPDTVPGEPTPHITDVHRSKVYVSSSTGQLKVALTLPIWSQAEFNPNRKFLGILGMSVSLGEFRELEADMGKDDLIMVVDTTENVLKNETLSGLLLHHPKMNNADNGGTRAVSADLLSELKAIRTEARETIVSQPTSSNIRFSKLLEQFQDPFDASEDNTRWTAAFSPIMVPGRPINIADTGWGVIVAERE